ncbi:MAG: restriction endonuclease subunit S [Ignavibacteriales bacterium]|nr:restriction endonuclease subunit S [Ignavibacteriales bacterium]
MKSRKIVVNDVCKLNAETISSSHSPQIIQYLDTSNITRNRIDTIQILDSNIAPFPSRAQRKVKRETIVYSTVRPEHEHFGFLENPEDNFIVSTGFLTIDVVDKNIEPKFLYYSLTRKNITNYLHTIAVNNVSSYPSINPNDLGNLELEIPNDKVIQQKIASVLSSLDSKIELNNRINAELEAMAKTLYDYWFVQFDFPNANGKPYKSSGGTMIWNKELKREIPEGWGVKSLGEFADTASGGTPLSTQAEYYENGNIPWINSGELNNPFILKGNKYITEKGLNNSSAKMFSAKILLIALYGATAGKVSLLLIPACTNQAVCAVIPKSEIFTNFLKFALSDLYKYLVNVSSGSARDNLSQDLIKDLKFIIPNKFMLSTFDKIINPTIQKISINIEQNQTLSTLRDWLLPMLMNGQVQVK